MPPAPPARARTASDATQTHAEADEDASNGSDDAAKVLLGAKDADATQTHAKADEDASNGSNDAAKVLLTFKDAVLWRNKCSLLIFMAGLFFIFAGRALAALPIVPAMADTLTLLIAMNAAAAIVLGRRPSATGVPVSAEACVRGVSFLAIRVARAIDDVARADDPASIVIVLSLLWVSACVGRFVEVTVGTHVLLALVWTAAFTLPVTLNAVIFDEGSEVGVMLPSVLATLRSVAAVPVRALASWLGVPPDKGAPTDSLETATTVVRTALVNAPVHVRFGSLVLAAFAASALPWMVLVRTSLLVYFSLRSGYAFQL